MSNLIELAERCEQHDGALRVEVAELLDEAFCECFPRPERIWITDNTGDWSPEYTAFHALQWRFQEFLQADAFLDAAMTLVPEGAEVTTQTFGGPGPMALVEPNERFASGSTLPLALCAAALRARAARETDDA